MARGANDHLELYSKFAGSILNGGMKVLGYDVEGGFKQPASSEDRAIAYDAAMLLMELRIERTLDLFRNGASAGALALARDDVASTVAKCTPPDGEYPAELATKLSRGKGLVEELDRRTLEATRALVAEAEAALMSSPGYGYESKLEFPIRYLLETHADDATLARAQAVRSQIKINGLEQNARDAEAMIAKIAAGPLSEDDQREAGILIGVNERPGRFDFNQLGETRRMEIEQLITTAADVSKRLAAVFGPEFPER